jgi:hypothetical protein
VLFTRERAALCAREQVSTPHWARPPPPRASTTLETDADFLAWEAGGRLFDGIH